MQFIPETSAPQVAQYAVQHKLSVLAASHASVRQVGRANRGSQGIDKVDESKRFTVVTLHSRTTHQHATNGLLAACKTLLAKDGSHARGNSVSAQGTAAFRAGLKAVKVA